MDASGTSRTRSSSAEQQGEGVSFATPEQLASDIAYGSLPIDEKRQRIRELVDLNPNDEGVRSYAEMVAMEAMAIRDEGA